MRSFKRWISLSMSVWAAFIASGWLNAVTVSWTRRRCSICLWGGWSDERVWPDEWTRGRAVGEGEDSRRFVVGGDGCSSTNRTRGFINQEGFPPADR